MCCHIQCYCTKKTEDLSFRAVNFIICMNTTFISKLIWKPTAQVTLSLACYSLLEKTENRKLHGTYLEVPQDPKPGFHGAFYSKFLNQDYMCHYRAVRWYSCQVSTSSLFFCTQLHTQTLPQIQQSSCTHLCQALVSICMNSIKTGMSSVRKRMYFYLCHNACRSAFYCCHGLLKKSVKAKQLQILKKREGRE